MSDDRFTEISDEDLWAEWVRRREAMRVWVAREYQRNYKRKSRAGVPKGKRGMRLMTMKHLKSPR